MALLAPAIITESEVESLLTPDDAFEAVTTALKSLSAGRSSNTVRARARTPKLTIHSMSAASEECGMAAAKVYTSTAGNVQTHLLLYDISSGNLRAIIEANNLGRLRTCAASVVAAKALTSGPARSLAIIGSGFQAEGILQAYLNASAFQIETVKVFSRNASSREQFVANAKEIHRTSQISAVTTAREAVEGADIVVTATTSSQPVLEHQWLSGTKHLSAIGSNALSRKEIPPKAVTGASAIVVDSLDVAKIESGNLLGAIENGKIQWAELSELGAVLNDPERLSRVSGSYTLFCSHGVAVEDLFLAAALIRKRDARQ